LLNTRLAAGEEVALLTEVELASVIALMAALRATGRGIGLAQFVGPSHMTADPTDGSFLDQ
jgi:hypothetical protein